MPLDMKDDKSIDKNKTKSNVDTLLKLYRRLLRMAQENHIPTITEDYTFEIEDSVMEVSNQLEGEKTRKLIAQQELQRIAKAINQIDSYHRRILYEKYLVSRPQTNIMIYMDLGISESKFYRDLEKAKLLFAKVYEDRKLIVNKY